MPEFVKKPVVVSAVQWFKNGDHPNDACTFLPDGSLTEGKLVRYFRHPSVNPKQKCHHCGHEMQSHGRIENLDNGFTVCPGDWIICGAYGEFYPCKPDIFAQTYSPKTNSPVTVKTLSDRMAEIHSNALSHGWWNDTKNYTERLAKIPEKILLTHCELSEAIEEYRQGNIKTYYAPESDKPEGVFVEIADAIIRLLDLCGACGVDIETLINEKHNYNLNRPFRHGNKKI